MTTPSLQTKRLLLLPLTLDFLSNKYLQWMKDYEVIKYIESGGPNYDLKMLETYLKQIESQNILSWAIVIKKNMLHIGNIKIDPINHKNLYGEYGILIGDKDAWGKGYGKEASIEVINFCFKKLLLRKINLGLVAENKKALNMYKSLGFVEEGRYKNHTLLDDKYTDVIRMALFNSKSYG